jgi:hypothetical protein
MTPGTYVWSWTTANGGTDNFTLEVPKFTVPEPATWATMLVGFAGLSFAGYRQSGKRAAFQ